jgi:hypothetical protein
MQRNKTQRRKPATPTTDVPGPFVSDTVAKATEDSLEALFAAETSANFHQPWQKLDRGSRLDRLRKFVQGYPDLTPAERASLLTAVLQAFELRQLNTKAVVEYDPATANITALRGLRERTLPSGLRTFRIDAAAAAAAATRTTQKQRKVATAAATAATTTSSLNSGSSSISTG